MKKFLGVVVAALVIALALWVALRVQQANRQLQVTELLPRTTLLFAHIPDFKRTRAQWQGSDLSALWHEPAVQAWLQKPLAALAKKRGDDKAFEEFMQLGPTNSFLALASIENNDPKFLGGFHFEKTEADARRFVEAREAPWLAKSGSAQREKITYREHQIETVNAGRFALATVYDRNWFFASNNLAALEALLDRAERRSQKAASGSLHESELYRAATKPLAADYAGMFFLDPQPFLEKLRPLLAMTGQPGAAERLEQFKGLRSFAGTIGFDHGKIRESIFVEMPRRDSGEKLTRPSLAAAGKDTFLYSASLPRWPATWQLASPPTALPAFLQQYAGALAQAGVQPGDLQAAFGEETEVIGEWAPDAHWPALFLTLPVRDVIRAHKIADAFATVELAGGGWTRSEKDGVTYYTHVGFGGFVPIHPSLAISERMLVAGSDLAAVEATINKKGSAGELVKSATFHDAENRLPAGDSGFHYLDTRLLFERADAALRPMLLMSATIYPALGNKMDAARLPPPEAITKHLSPIVMSQRYTGDGYLSESVGPVTFNEAAIGLLGVIGGCYVYLQHGFGDFGHPKSPTPVPAPSSTPP